MRVLLSIAGFTADTLFNPHARDHCQEPFIALRNALQQRGAELVTMDAWDCGAIDAFLAWDLPPRDVYSMAIWQGKPRRQVLILAEPPVVRPDNYDVRKHHLFHAVLTWHDKLVDCVRYHKYHWPQPAAMPPIDDTPFDKRQLVTQISGDKHSPIEGELYTLRRRLNTYFEQHEPYFTFFGAGWNIHQWPGYGGVCDHKAQVYSKYRFALVLENQSAPGWISEKLFDAIRCGIVPVYLGAPNIASYVPRDAYIDMGQFGTIDELATFLRAVTESEWQQYRDAGRAFIDSAAFDVWKSSTFARRVCEALNV